MMVGGISSLLACGSLSFASSHNQIKFSHNPAISWPQLYIALRDGLWKKNGLDVAHTEARFGTGQSAMQAMLLSGDSQMAAVAETPVALALMGGMPLKILASLSHTPWHISTSRRANVNSIADLSGRRLGVPVGTSAEYFMNQALHSVGLTPGDVEVVNVKPTDMVPALSGGSLDAFFIWDPFRFEARKVLGDDYVELAYPEFQSNAFLVARSDFVDSNPDQVDAILRTMIEAETHMKKDPKGSVEYMADLMQLEPSIAQAVWDTHTYDVSLRAGMIEALNAYSQYMIDRGMVAKDTQIPDFRALMMVDHLRDIDSTRVDL